MEGEFHGFQGVVKLGTGLSCVSMTRMHMAMMPVESSGNSDVHFVRLMVPHHQAAIDMSNQSKGGLQLGVRKMLLPFRRDAACRETGGIV